jgi:hypothetical protein
VEPSDVPNVLRERLGNAGVTSLAEVLAVERTDIVTLVMDSFERRLAEECGRLRTDLRAEMAAFRFDLRSEMKDLRLELGAAFKVEVANVGSDLIKWSFLFWIGQVIAVVSLAAAFG